MKFKNPLSSFLVTSILLSSAIGHGQALDQYTRLMDIDSGDVMIEPFFAYDLSRHNEIKMGAVSFSEKDFSFRVVKVKDLYQFQEAAEDKFLNQSLLLIKYPKNMMTGKDLSIQVVAGKQESKILWNDEARDDLKHFFEEVELYRGVLKTNSEVVDGKISADLIIPIQGVLVEIGDSRVNVVPNNKLSLCLNQQDTVNDTLFMKICWSSDEKTAAVRINNIEQAIIGEKKITKDEAIHFEAELKKISLQFQAKLPEMSVLDVVPYGKNHYKITGAGSLPLADAKYMESQKSKLLSRIYLPSNNWVGLISQNEAKLYFAGHGGGVFGVAIAVGSDVQDKYVFLMLDDLKPTYLSKKILHGKKSSHLKLQSKSGGLVVPSMASTALLTPFELEVELPNKEGPNIVELTAESASSQKFSYKIRLDRAYAAGLSFRLMGGQLESQSSAFEGQFLPYGAIAGYYWFEDFLFLQNSFFSQRFGVTGRYLNALKKYEIMGSPVIQSQMSQQNLGLRMRFLSGIYGQDEGGGLSFNYQNLTLGDLSYPTAGLGFFWALPMPGFLDEAIDAIFMQYPKWLDVEAVYYPMSLKSDVKLKPMYGLNLTSKLVIDTNYFSELGLSYEKFGFKVLNKEQELSNTSVMFAFGVQF